MKTEGNPYHSCDHEAEDRDTVPDNADSQVKPEDAWASDRQWATVVKGTGSRFNCLDSDFPSSYQHGHLEQVAPHLCA